MKKKQHVIARIAPGSIAEELELEPQDILLSINGQEIEDIFDYQYLTDDENITLLVQKKNGEQWELEIEKDEDEDLGIEFENGLMDDYKSCSNKCIFCFIDQMPPGMRETLYFKDDDSRLSFLQGNYVTLTNMKDADVERIIRYRMAPINISVHTTNPALRCKMLNNRFAGDALKKIDRFFEAEIPMNGQVVLCKGINDGEELDRTIRDLTKYLPYMESLSVVPVGLTKYRKGLYPLEPFGKADAKNVIALIEKWQTYCMEKYGTHFVHASDEWYLTAELPLPEEERYDGYLQLENGVGMIRLLMNEFDEALEAYVRQTENDVTDDVGKWNGTEWAERQEIVTEGNHPEVKVRVIENEIDDAEKLRPNNAETETAPNGSITDNEGGKHELTLATGILMEPYLREMSDRFMQKFPNYSVSVRAIRNDFFGERITVSGLITGQDLVAQLRGTKLGSRLLLPCNMLRSGEQVFLDDMTVVELENALQVRVDIVKSSGQDLLFSMLQIAE